jgi:hypothetical protein
MKKDEPIGPSYGYPSDGHPSVLHFEVKNIHYLEVHPVHQDDVSTDEHVGTVRRWRRQAPFEVWRARKHLSPQLHGKYPVNHNPSFHFGRQVVAIPQAGGQVIVMLRVPAVHRLAVVVAVEMISVVSFSGFLSVAAPIMVTSVVLGQS